MQAAGMIDLGLTAATFWGMTPRVFQMMWNHHQRREERTDRRFALIACILANVNRDTKAKPFPFTIEDFVPGAKKSDVVEIPEGATPAERIAVVMRARNRQPAEMQRAVIREWDAGRNQKPGDVIVEKTG